jgi:hypothetical protein
MQHDNARYRFQATKHVFVIIQTVANLIDNGIICVFAKKKLLPMYDFDRPGRAADWFVTVNDDIDVGMFAQFR